MHMCTMTDTLLNINLNVYFLTVRRHAQNAMVMDTGIAMDNRGSGILYKISSHPSPNGATMLRATIVIKILHVLHTPRCLLFINFKVGIVILVISESWVRRSVVLK